MITLEVINNQEPNMPGIVHQCNTALEILT